MSILDKLLLAINEESWELVKEVYLDMGGQNTDKAKPKKRPRKTKKDTDQEEDIDAKNIVSISGQAKAVSTNLSPSGQRQINFVTLGDKRKVENSLKKPIKPVHSKPKRPSGIVNAKCLGCGVDFQVHKSIIPDSGFRCNTCIIRRR